MLQDTLQTRPLWISVFRGFFEDVAALTYRKASGFGIIFQLHAPYFCGPDVRQTFACLCPSSCRARDNILPPFFYVTGRSWN